MIVGIAKRRIGGRMRPCLDTRETQNTEGWPRSRPAPFPSRSRSGRNPFRAAPAARTSEVQITRLGPAVQVQPNLAWWEQALLPRNPRWGRLRRTGTCLAKENGQGERENGDRSSRQGRNPAGAGPAVPVARFRHVAMPVLRAGNDPEFGLVYMARPPKTHRGLAVGATWGPSELWSLNMSE